MEFIHIKIVIYQKFINNFKTLLLNKIFIPPETFRESVSLFKVLTSLFSLKITLNIPPLNLMIICCQSIQLSLYTRCKSIINLNLIHLINHN